jgi:formylglycine-generating enzyme required for sulfatase activity
MGMDAEQAMEMFCPPGSSPFCIRDNFALADPAHIVYLDGYWIDQTEVTNNMYKQCVKAGDCEAPPLCTMLPSGIATYYDYDPKYENHPMGCATWYAAQDYCTWVGGKLPSEAEWEKAARGTDGRLYPWGNEAPTCLLSNSGGRCVGLTKPVGSYPAGASPYGVLNMAGNMHEWVVDLFVFYPGNHNDGTGYYMDFLNEGDRVVRGGAYASSEGGITTFNRGGSAPDYHWYGFRCVVMP